MAKDFMEELMDELNDLHLEEVRRLHDAFENRERLPLILTPATILRTVYQTARNHQITGEELMQLLGSQAVSSEEAIELTRLAKQLDQEGE